MLQIIFRQRQRVSMEMEPFCVLDDDTWFGES